MLRPILVCLGVLAAVGGPSKCGGAVVSERPGTNDAGSSEAAANAASGSPLQVPGAAGASGFGGGASGTGPTGTGPSLGGPVLIGGSNGCQSDAGPGGAPGLVTLASGQTCPWGMAIDAINVYWTECGDPTGGFVLKVPKAGGDVVALASGDRLSGIATDGTNVYWVAGTSDASSGAIMKVPVVGGTPTTLAARSGDPAHLVVDDTYAYWGEMTGGSITKVPLTGGTPGEVAPAQMPFQLTVDATDVYWLGNGVMKVPKVGGTAIQLTGPQGPTLPPAGIAVNATNVYWTSGPPFGTSGVSTVPIGGGTPTVVCASPQSMLGGPIALDATSVYWADGCDTVFAAPLAGGTAMTLATGQNNVDAIAVDATSVYWLVNGNGGEGFVMKLPLHLTP